MADRSLTASRIRSVAHEEPDEYERRFKGLTLDAFRASMSPELFETYVRFVGLIPGCRDIDVVEITRLPDGG